MRPRVIALVVALLLVAGSGVALAWGWGDRTEGEKPARPAGAWLEALALTDDQRAAITALKDEYAPQLAASHQALVEARKNKDWEAFGKAAADCARLRDELQTALLEVLTPEQVEQLKGFPGMRGRWKQKGDETAPFGGFHGWRGKRFPGGWKWLPGRNGASDGNGTGGA